MSSNVRRVEYFRTEVEDRPGEGYELLARLARAEVNLLAIQAMPIGPSQTQFTLFPESSEQMIRAADKFGLTLSGPHSAIMICGDDKLGALLDYHRKLADARVNVYATSAITDGVGHYGYVIHVRPEHFEAAANALGAD